MNDYVLSCCSTTDLSAEYLKGRNIPYLGYTYFMDGQKLHDDFGQSLQHSSFYSMMKTGSDTKTTQLNATEYEEYFTPFLKEGKDVLHVTLSSGLSGSYNSAMIAKETLKKQFPDRKLIIVDSLGASSGSGLLVSKLADLRDEGWRLDDVASWAEKHKQNVQHWFFSSDLTFYIKGGRISKTQGFIGTTMNICPLLDVNSEGKLIPRAKIRGTKRAIKALVKRMVELAQDGQQYSDTCFISHSDCLVDAETVATLVMETFPNLKEKPSIFSIGPTIGSHTGPGTVALFFWGKPRLNE